MTQKRLELKNEIKSLAQQIKDKKKNLRNKELRAFVAEQIAKSREEVDLFSIALEQEYERKQKENPSKPNKLSQERDKKSRWNEHRDLVRSLQEPFEGILPLQEQFRAKHVIASLMRGKTRLQIESNVHQNNPYVESFITKLIEEYKNEVWFDISLLNKNDKEGAFRPKEVAVEEPKKGFVHNLFARKETA